jgi:hypothetical protein
LVYCQHFAGANSGVKALFLKLLAGILLGLWLLLVVMGKGGFVHLLLLNGISVVMIDLVAAYRSRMTSGKHQT